MIRSYVRIYRSTRPTQWLRRSLCSERNASGTQRKRGRSKVDEDVTKKPPVGRRRVGMLDGTGDDERVAEREIKVNTDGPTNVRGSTITARRASAGSLAKDAPKSEDKKSKMKKALRMYDRLLGPSSKHHDLTSFHKYAAMAKLDTQTSVYKGTQYEYTVAEALKAYNFALVRIGRSNDLGIDLIGNWALPGHCTKRLSEMSVLVQCKAYKAGPRMVRELEAAHGGAPAGWRGEEVFRLLVANGKSTLSIIKALQISRYPMGYMEMNLKGKLKQLWWNDAATQAGLQGMSTTMKYTANAGKDKDAQSDEANIPEGTVALTWNGKLWLPKSAKDAAKKNTTKKPRQKAELKD